MKKRTSRILSLTLLCAMALGLLAGCSNSGGNGSDSGDNGSGEVKDTITVATMAETPSVSPYDHNATAGYLVNLLTFTSLVRLDENLNAQPDLAESFTNISDTCWEFKLRQDVKFHDGSSMTAEDVKASLDYAKTFTEGALYNDSIESVEVVDEYTVRINTKVPDAALMFNLAQHANAIVPKALIDSGNNFGENPIGAGPYKFVSWTRGDQLEFEAFDEYYGRPLHQARDLEDHPRRLQPHHCSGSRRSGYGRGCGDHGRGPHQGEPGPGHDRVHTCQHELADAEQRSIWPG